jgi:hypothetical protein
MIVGVVVPERGRPALAADLRRSCMARSTALRGGGFLRLSVAPPPPSGKMDAWLH